jgi:hypothetical protein
MAAGPDPTRTARSQPIHTDGFYDISGWRMGSGTAMRKVERLAAFAFGPVSLIESWVQKYGKKTDFGQYGIRWN